MAKKEEEGKKVVEEANIKRAKRQKELTELINMPPELVEDEEIFTKVAQDIATL